MSACTSDDEQDATSTTVPLEVVRIGVVTGAGQGAVEVRTAVKAAAGEANRQGRVIGWQVEVLEQSAASPEEAAQAARTLADNDRLAGAVVALEEASLRAALDVFETERILVVSPDAVAVGLTRGDDSRPERPYTVFHRVAPHASSLGGAAGQFALRELNAKTVAVATDGGAEGAAMAATFTRQIERGGSEVGLTATIGAGGSGSQAAVGQVGGSDAGVVFVGAESDSFEAFLGQAVTASLRVPVIGAGPVDTDNAVPTPATDEMRVFAAGPAGPDAGDTDELETAWEEAGGRGEPGPAAARAYDAANVIIDAIAAALQDQRGFAAQVRPTTVNAAGRVTFEGASGEIGFDDFGDALHQLVTIYRLAGDRWQPVTTTRFLPNQ